MCQAWTDRLYDNTVVSMDSNTHSRKQVEREFWEFKVQSDCIHDRFKEEYKHGIRIGASYEYEPYYDRWRR